MNSPQILTFGHAVPKVKSVFQRLSGLYQFAFVPYSFAINHRERVDRLLFAILLVSDNFQIALQKLKEIRNASATLPVLLVSKKMTERQIIAAHRAGASDFLLEPFGSKDLLDFIDRFLVTKHSPTWQRPKKPFQTLLQKIKSVIRFPAYNLVPEDCGVVAFPPYYPQEEVMKKIDLHVQFLGNFELIFRGKTITIQSAKARSLLAYLLFHRHKKHHRDILMDKFWPDSSPESARNSLNVAMHAIRKAFQQVDEGRDCILYKQECYSFCESLRIETDVDLFRQHWELANSKEALQTHSEIVPIYFKAFAFYKAEFLEDFLYDEWTLPYRENLRESYLVVLERLCDHFFEEKQYKKAIDYAKLMLQVDPYLEEIHHKLMLSYAHLGRRGKALQQYRKCEKLFKEELGAELPATMKVLGERLGG